MHDTIHGIKLSDEIDHAVRITMVNQNGGGILSRGFSSPHKRTLERLAKIAIYLRNRKARQVEPPRPAAIPLVPMSVVSEESHYQTVLIKLSL